MKEKPASTAEKFKQYLGKASLFQVNAGSGKINLTTFSLINQEE